MKNLVFIILFVGLLFVAGCDNSHNFMDVDNPNAKEDLKYYIGSGNLPKLSSGNIIPDSLSGTWNNVKGYAEQYYENTVEEYVDQAKQGLSGAVQNLKDYYNNGVDQITSTINDKVTGAISGEMNKFKL